MLRVAAGFGCFLLSCLALAADPTPKGVEKGTETRSAVSPAIDAKAIILGAEKSDTDSKSKEDFKTFTDKIKTFRVYGDDYDVFFMENGGPYEVPFSLANSKNKDMLPDEILSEAYKNGTPITVTVNLRTETLVSIDADVSRQPASVEEKPLSKEYEAYKDIIEKALGPKK